MNLKDLIPTYHAAVDESFQYQFTVFTPIFNCEKTVSRVHQSLLNQTFTDFEWLIINDGSTDNSHRVIENLVANSPLTIHYINNVNNQHKMSCFIQAISLAQGELLLTLDGDDECTSNALKSFREEYLNIPNNIKNKVSAVTALCQDQYGEQIGDIFPTDPYYSNTFKSHAIDNLHGEKWGFTKTLILKGISVNNEIFNKGLIPEGIIWNLLAKEGFITKYINKVLRVYHLDVENSLSSTSISKRAFGAVINSISTLNWFFKTYRFKTPIYFLKNVYVLLRASRHLNYHLKDYLNAIDSKIVCILITILWPLKKLFKY